MIEQLTPILEALRVFWLQVVSYLPRLIGAGILLIVGWMIAKFVRRIAVRLMKHARFDELAERAGIEDFLLRGRVSLTTVTILGGIIYWFIMAIVILAVFNVLGLTVAADLFDKIVLYVPNIVVAVLVLIFGSLLARFAQRTAYTFLSNLGIEGAQMMSVIAKYGILVFAVSIALEQLQIGQQIVVSAFQIAFGALCLALAIAFGLGGRDWAATVINNMSKKPK